MIKFIPQKTIKYIYLTLLKPRPIRWMVDKIIASMIPKKIDLPEGMVFLDRHDVGVCGALAFGVHDPFEIEVFRKTIKPGMRVIDIGANIGYYTVIAAYHVGSSGQVLAYEPEEKNFNLLNQNIEINKFSWVKAFKDAVSDQTGTRELYLAEEGHTGVHSFANNRHMTRTMQVHTVTLDSSLQKFGSPQIDIIKMDIEGAETLAIEGMVETIARSPDLILFTEFYPQALRRFDKDPLQFLNRLAGLGFSISIVDEDKKQVNPLPQSEFPNYVASFSKDGEVAANLLCRKKV